MASSILFYGFKAEVLANIPSSPEYTMQFISIDHEANIHQCASWHDFMKFKQQPWDESLCNEEEYGHLIGHSSIVYECYSRHFRHSLKTIFSVQDYQFIMRSHYVFVKYLLDKVAPRKIVFANLPHEGFDNILHLVAVWNGIDVCSCFQLPYVPRFIYLNLQSNLAQAFDKVVSPKKNLPVIQEERNCINYYLDCLLGKSEYRYMTNITADGIPPWRLLREHLYSSLRYCFQGQNRPRLLSTLSIFFLQLRQARYNKLVDSLARSYGSINVSNGFIYFPLHLQPELTTSVLGSIYCDQTIALARVSRLANEIGLSVICKDNPKQSFSHRSSFFFQAIRELENVYVVPTNTSSRLLVRESSMVATVCGTAGLEALAYGIPVWCLGGSWWKQFGNVATTYAEAMVRVTQSQQFCRKIDIQNCSASELLMTELLQLADQSLPGCTDYEYCQEFNISSSSNSRILANSLECVLKGN